MKSSNPLLRSHLTRLSRQLDKHVEFIGYAGRGRQPGDDEDSVGTTVAKTAGVVAGGAALYGAGSYLRGRLGQKPGNWNLAQGKPGIAGVVANVKAGHSANVADAKTAWSGVKQAYAGANEAMAPGIAKVAGAVRPGFTGVAANVNAGINLLRPAVGTVTNAIGDRAGALAQAGKSAGQGLANTLALKSKLFRGGFRK